LELTVNTGSALKRLCGTPIVPSTSNLVEADSAFSSCHDDYVGHTGIDLYALCSASRQDIVAVFGLVAPHRGPNPLTTNRSSGTMFQKRRLTNSGDAGSSTDPNRCEGIQRLPWCQLPDCLNLTAKKQRVVDGAKILDVAKESADPNRCERVRRLPSSQSFDCLNLPAKRQRVADGVKILLDVAKESADWFPPLKSALGGVGALIKHYEVLDSFVAVAHN
jgi:hypothetical protein